MNSVHLIGNLTRDPEIRYTQSGTAITNFGVAINRTWTDNGEKKEKTTFVDITSFGKQGEVIAQYFKKGRKIGISGRLELDQWEDKQTQQKRSKLFVVCEQFYFADSERSEAAPTARPPSARPTPTPAPPQDNDDSDVPF